MALALATISIESGTVLLLITLIALPIAAIAFAGSGRAWREIGKGPFAIEQDLPPQGPPGPALEVEAELKDLLERADLVGSG